jgi:uncharacterized protein
MKKLNIDHLKDIAIGSSILGSGGGGENNLTYTMTEVVMQKNQTFSLINFSELKPDDYILPVGFIGAPSVETEKIASGKEFEVLIAHAEAILERKITVVMPFEIGGINAFCPFIIAAKTGLPILDADTMGRAFPEAQMTSCNLLGANPSPGFITDCLGNTTVIYADRTATLEGIGRQVTVSMGSSAAFGFFPMNSVEAEKFTFHKSISKALSIGKVFREAKEAGKDPVEAVIQACKGVHLCSGKIVDIDQTISKAFLYGSVMIQNRQEKIQLDFQNEYLVAKRDQKILATTPDILVLLEQETGTPISAQRLEFGLKVHLVALPAAAMWTTPAGLSLVGPRHFGYEIDYHPVSQLKQNQKIGTFDVQEVSCENLT